MLIFVFLPYSAPRFGSEAEALSLANDTPAGLASYVFTRDVGRLWRVAEALEYGMVGANTGVSENVKRRRAVSGRFFLFLLLFLGGGEGALDTF